MSYQAVDSVSATGARLGGVDAVPGPQTSPWWALLLLAAWVSVSALWFASPWFPLGALRQVQQATAGWVTVTLMASGAIGLVSLAIVFWPGHQSLRDVGWRARQVLPGLAITVLLWASMQGATLLYALASGTALVPAPRWTQGLGVALGPLLAQLLGTALVEETLFRGYLWPQLVLWLRRGLPPWSAASLGLLLSQVLFALLHVPMLLHRGVAGGALAGALLMMFAVGVVFALVYAMTGNLFVAVGAHAVGNAPTLLFQPQGPSPTLVMLAALLLLCGGYWLWHRRQSARQTATCPTGHASPRSP